jgi:hypothetical protein
MIYVGERNSYVNSSLSARSEELSGQFLTVSNDFCYLLFETADIVYSELDNSRVSAVLARSQTALPQNKGLI